MNREELDQATAEVDATEKLAAAKEAFKADPSDENQAAYDAATQEIVAARQARRSSNAPAPQSGDGVAAPDPVAPAAQP